MKLPIGSARIKPGSMLRHSSLFALVFFSVRLAAFSAEPITPRETLVLFNGKDLSNFTTWETAHGREDPDRVFSVVDQIDGAPAIRASGQHDGGILTKEHYTNYHLVLEFRWGIVTWGSRKDRARDSGILLHCQGEEGNMNKTFTSPWMRSIEAQIIEGGTGDILVLGGFERGQEQPLKPSLKSTVQGKSWSPGGELKQYSGGRIDWQHRDPQWKDVLGFRGVKDVEKPVGAWNRYEVIADRGNLIYLLNGVKVNEGKDGSLTEGKILFQSEGAEIYFRRIELHPLKK